MTEGRPAAFDSAASSYDRDFTHTALGRLLRRRVWERLDRSFGPGDRVLELGCGTGEDAIHLASRGVAVLATDSSERMLAVAQAKVTTAGAEDLVRLDQLDVTSVDLQGRLRALASEPFDGAFSDFGALNTVSHRYALAEGLGSVMQIGGRLVVVVMGPFCPWEMAWHAAHGEPRAAVRRWRRGGVARVGDRIRTRVWYPSPARLRREFAPSFRLVDTAALGVALPPSGLAGVVEHRPRLRAALATAEQVVAGRGWAPWAADHHMTTLERV